MHGRRTAVGAAAAALVLGTQSPAAAAPPIADYEMPFPCGQEWKGDTRSGHSPSFYSVDWNRYDDVDDPVVASAAGTVTTADNYPDSGYGKYVVVDHGNGEKTYYAHLNSVKVSNGQRIDQGQQLGTLGSTGNSSGPHLHYEQRLDGTVVWPYFHQQKFVFGSTLASRNCVDVPLAADWFADGKADVTVFRRADPASFRIHREGTTPAVRKLGTAVDEPVAGDWDGNGTANPGVRSPLTNKFTLRSAAGTQTFGFGVGSDKPVAGNFVPGKAWEVGVWRASTQQFLIRRPGQAHLVMRLGDANDLPVTGDWDSDGLTDVGVYDQSTSTFTLRKVDAEGDVWLATVSFGSPGDLPVTGDWDGNGRTDLGTWTPATGVFNKRIASSPTATMRSVTTLRFGRAR